MKQKPKKSTENSIQEIRPKIRRHFSLEEKLVIVMEANREEYSIAELCLKHRITEATLNGWNKDFKEANKWKMF